MRLVSILLRNNNNHRQEHRSLPRGLGAYTGRAGAPRSGLGRRRGGPPLGAWRPSNPWFNFSICPLKFFMCAFLLRGFVYAKRTWPTPTIAPIIAPIICVCETHLAYIDNYPNHCPNYLCMRNTLGRRGEV